MSMGLFDDLVVRGGLVENKNQLQLFNRVNFSMYPARAFAVTLNRLFIDKGENYVKDLGKIMGNSSAREFFTNISKMRSLIRKEYQTVPHLIEISGFGKFDDFIEDEKEFVMQIKKHPVISSAKELGMDKGFICDFYGEIYSSYVGVFLSKKGLKIKHTKCVCKGDEFCEWRMTK